MEVGLHIRDTLFGWLTAVFVVVVLTPIASAITVHTSENLEDHNATYNPITGLPIPGVESLDSGGVVSIVTSHPIIDLTRGSGVLLNGSRYVLTAAHIFDDDIQAQEGDDVLTFEIFLRSTTTDPEQQPALFSQTYDASPRDLDTPPPGVGANLYIHPEHIELGDIFGAIPSTLNPNQFTSGFLAGYDIAIIDLGLEAAEELQQSGFPTHSLFVGSPVGQEFVVVGWGLTGTGATGFVNNENASERYWGINKFDAVNTPIPGTAREMTQLLFDFDDGPGDWNPNDNHNGDHDGLAAIPPGFTDPLNLPGESMITPGDSGGPMFVFTGGQWKVAAITSYFWSGPRDLDNATNATYGEIGAGVNLNAPNAYEDDPTTPYDDTQVTIADWIHKTTGIASRFQNSSGGALTNPSNWTFSQLPTPTMDAYVQFDTANPTDVVAIDGPAFTPGLESFNVASLTMAAGQGHKILFHENGGAINMTGDFTLDTNNSVGFFNGDISANRLIIQAYSSVPDPARALFFWQDASNSTNLSVNRIIAANGGDFSYNVSNPNQLDANHLDLDEFGHAFLETDITINDSVTN